MSISKHQNALISLAIGLLFVNIPNGTAHATTLEQSMDNYQTGQQLQNITNGLSDIGNSINTQTRVFQDTLRQQQIGLLDPACVSSVVAQVRAKDGSVETQRMIDEYRNEMETAMDMSNPVVAQQATSYLNYLYRYLETQNTQLFNLLIQYCPKKIAPQVQQTAPSTSLQCNGKAWLDCPTGQRFFCPATGDAQCVIDQVPEVAIQTIDTIQTPTSFQETTEKTKRERTGSIKEKDTDTTSAPASTFKPGLILRLWSWFTGLFAL